MPSCEVRYMGRIEYDRARAFEQALVEQRKQGSIPDQLLLLEHPPVVTMGRNGRRENLLADEQMLARAGVDFHHADRGGDVTFHGHGQLVGYPILDLREWKRDVVAYVRALEEVLIGTLGAFGIAAGRLHGSTGVWVGDAKIAAIGVHLSRWVTSHGFALNVHTDLQYFRYIVPCGLPRPVTSMQALGSRARLEEVAGVLVEHFREVFGRRMAWRENND